MREVAAEFARQRAPGAGWWWLCAALLAACLALTVMTLQTRERARLVSQQADEAEAQVRIAREAAQRPPTPAAPPPYEASAREMLAAHSVLWPTLLAALEATAVPGVRVMTLDYEAARATARVEFAFDQPASMPKLLDELNAGSSEPGAAWRWQLLEMDQRNAAEPGRAVLEARWSKANQ
jgi:hypothetical protein